MFYDIEEVENGWLVSTLCGKVFHYNHVHFALMYNGGTAAYKPSLAAVPGLGVGAGIADSGSVRFWATPDQVAMDAMSGARTRWMTAVIRAPW